ncbi:hypothetical protein CPC08DRAFT_764688 [Agrocybe pediades]|nr:hypothetical protein CPC08DRAFT_764688 [Agrocybe pediades]
MLKNTRNMFIVMAKTTSSRRSVWESKDAAHSWLKARIPWKLWDPRVLNLYTEHGLRSLPTPVHNEKKGVVLACSPAQEGAAYLGEKDTLKSIAQFTRASGIIPFHGVYGARNDMFTREIQDSLHDPSAGRVLASAWRVSGAGHLVPLENPGNLAEVLKHVLASGERRKWEYIPHSKL